MVRRRKESKIKIQLSCIKIEALNRQSIPAYLQKFIEKKSIEFKINLAAPACL